jgi:hypothetical protein
MPSSIAMTKKSAGSLIKKFVMHLWNPEVGYLNNYRYYCIFFALTVVSKEGFIIIKKM